MPTCPLGPCEEPSVWRRRAPNCARLGCKIATAASASEEAIMDLGFTGTILPSAMRSGAFCRSGIPADTCNKLIAGRHPSNDDSLRWTDLARLEKIRVELHRCQEVLVRDVKGNHAAGAVGECRHYAALNQRPGCGACPAWEARIRGGLRHCAPTDPIRCLRPGGLHPAVVPALCRGLVDHVKVLVCTYGDIVPSGIDVV